MGFRLRKYRLTVEDAGRLSKVWSVRISRVRLVCTLVVCCLLFMGLGACFGIPFPYKASCARIYH